MRFSVIFAKVSTFGNSKSSKREGFSTRNHGYFLKRETRKFFQNKTKIIKKRQFSKALFISTLIVVNYNNTWCLFFFEAANFSYSNSRIFFLQNLFQKSLNAKVLIVKMSVKVSPLKYPYTFIFIDILKCCQFHISILSNSC